jgi:hypothetical protein
VHTDLTVGDRTIRLAQLNGYKAVRAGRLMAEALRCAPAVNEALAALRRSYATDNALVVTPQMAKLPRFHREAIGEDGQLVEVPIFTEADFKDGEPIRIPQEPPMQEQIVAVFPIVFEAAEAQVVELLALVAAPNSELAEADRNGTVDAYLKDAGRALLHEATVDQLVALALAATEQVTEALAGDGDGVLGKVLAAAQGRPARAATPAPEPQPTPPSTPESSTGSPEPMAGRGPTASTSPAGEMSESLSSV